MRSFRKATCWISFGNFFEKNLLNIFSVSLHLNDWIMFSNLITITYNVKRYILKHDNLLDIDFVAICHIEVQCSSYAVLCKCCFILNSGIKLQKCIYFCVANCTIPQKALAKNWC